MKQEKLRCPLCNLWASKTKYKGKMVFKCQKCGFVFDSEEEKERFEKENMGGM